MQAEFGVIGGTGLYDPKLLKNVQEVTVDTPYGKPSDAITIGELGGKLVAFLPRHGKKHTIRPTDINVRANIFALKKLGVKRILGAFNGWFFTRRVPSRRNRVCGPIHRSNYTSRTIILYSSRRKGLPHFRC